MLLPSTMFLFFGAVLKDLLEINNFLDLLRGCRVVYLTAAL
jgi:hypothetical protein